MQGILCFALFLVAGTAAAAGFNCAKAKSSVEKLICTDQDLSKLDEELNSAFGLASAAFEGNQRKDFEHAQRFWLSSVRDKCNDAPCLSSAYKERVTELQKHYRSLPLYPLCQGIEVEGTVLKRIARGPAVPGGRLEFTVIDMGQPHLFLNKHPNESCEFDDPREIVSREIQVASDGLRAVPDGMRVRVKGSAYPDPGTWYYVRDVAFSLERIVRQSPR